LAYRSHLWYTSPWAFNELFQISCLDETISQLEVWQVSSSSSTTVGSSRIVRMDSTCNKVSPILTRTSIMCPENIEELRLSCCDRDIDLKLPSLPHLHVISSLDALHRCSSISMKIQSIIIGLYRWAISYATGNWTALHSLRSFPRLRSLRVVLCDLYLSPDDPSCEIIAQTTVSIVNFSLSFRRDRGFSGINSESAFNRCCSVEEDGCGLIVWREQRCQGSTQTII
jgi:hypothetical protein